MQKATLLIFLFILTSKYCSLYGQQAGSDRSNYWYYYDVHYENERNDINKKNRLKQRKVISKSPHKTRTTIVLYDTSGRVSSYKHQNKEVKINYFVNSLKRETMIFRRGKFVSRDSFSWDNERLIYVFHYDKQNQLKRKQSYKYDSIFVTEYKFEKVKKERLREMNKTIYEYYPDHSYKKITYYKKGRPSYYSVFDCNPLGEKHKINKDSSYNCIKFDTDSLGNKIKVSVLNEKKYSRKTIEYFNEKDQRIAQKIYDQKKNQILWYIMYKPGAVWALTKYISYKKGKEYYRIENTYNENNDCTSFTTYKRGKINYRNVNIYNTKGLLEKSELFNKRNKKKGETNYLFEYY